jgi:hypothetical protein
MLDDDDYNNTNSILYLFTRLLSSQNANYKISKTINGNKQEHTHKQRQIQNKATYVI